MDYWNTGQTSIIYMLIHNNNPTLNPKYKMILETFDLKAVKKLNQLRTEVGNPKLS